MRWVLATTATVTAITAGAVTLGIGLVATNDCHYLYADDAKAHEILLCIQSKKTRDDPKAWKLGTHELYVKGPEEMAAAFAEHPEAVTNTVASNTRNRL